MITHQVKGPKDEMIRIILLILYYINRITLFFWGIHPDNRSIKVFDSFPFVLAIFLAGTLGGVTNNYIRLKAIPADQAIFPNTTTNQLAIIQVYVSPIIAGVFGCILYYIFVSGILRGALFPEFTGVEENFQSVSEIFNTIDPKTNQDSVKAIVWSFVAGFSEKMVPNIIDKIAEDTKKQDKNNGANGNSKNNADASDKGAS